VTALPTVIEESLRNLREIVDTNPSRARGLLATLLGPIPLHRRGERVIAELRGNLPRLLDLDPHWDKSGAGRGISYLPHWPSSTWRFRGPWTTAAR